MKELGDRMGTVTSSGNDGRGIPPMGRVRTIFPYRSDANAYAARLARACAVIGKDDLNQPLSVAQLVQDPRLEGLEDPYEAVARRVTETNTVIEAIGSSEAWSFVAFNNNTPFVADPSNFCVAFSRNKQFLVMFGDFNYMTGRSADPRVRGILLTMKRMGWTVSLNPDRMKPELVAQDTIRHLRKLADRHTSTRDQAQLSRAVGIAIQNVRAELPPRVERFEENHLKDMRTIGKDKLQRACVRQKLRLVPNKAGVIHRATVHHELPPDAVDEATTLNKDVAADALQNLRNGTVLLET